MLSFVPISSMTFSDPNFVTRSTEPVWRAHRFHWDSTKHHHYITLCKFLQCCTFSKPETNSLSQTVLFAAAKVAQRYMDPGSDYKPL